MNSNIDMLYTLYKSVMFANFKHMYPKIKDIGLYPGQPELLRAIANNNGITQVDLAHITNREKATITRAIQRLTTKGYIKRMPDAFDKRKIHLYISDKGKKVISNIQKLMDEATNFCFSDLTDDEILFLISILEKIRNKFNNEGNE